VDAMLVVIKAAYLVLCGCGRGKKATGAKLRTVMRLRIIFAFLVLLSVQNLTVPLTRVTSPLPEGPLRPASLATLQTLLPGQVLENRSNVGPT